MKAKNLVFFIIFSLIIAFVGCAGSRIYLIDVKYIPEKKVPCTSRIVGVCPFEDLRKEKEKEDIGLRYRGSKHVDFLKVEGMSVSESVTQAVKDYFSESGFKVMDCKQWDKSLEGLSSVPEELSLVVGGNIESFMVEARSGITITDTKYNMKLVAFIGQRGQKKIVIRTIESEPKTKKMGFDIVELRDKLNHTLTEVIQNLFQDAY